MCESLYTEDEVEQASDEGFACTSCTPYVPKPVGRWPDFTVWVYRRYVECLQQLATQSFTLSMTFLALVVESAIMASIKIKEAGQLSPSTSHTLPPPIYLLS